MNAPASDPLLHPDRENPQDKPRGWHAELELRFARRGERTSLVHNRHIGPLRVQKPLYPEGEGCCHAIVLHPPAGIVGGDTLRVDVAVGDGAHALLTTPGAGKWYRSDGRRAALRQCLRVEAEAVCEWLPQESIVFDGALGELSTEIELDPRARLIAAEMLCFGRTGAGERFDHGQLAMHTRIVRGGRTLWLEHGRVDGGGDLLASPAGLAGEPVVGTLLIVAPGLDEGIRDACREIGSEVGRGAVTLLPTAVLVARWLGPACEPGRTWFSRIWACVRPAVAGCAMRAPRIWST